MTPLSLDPGIEPTREVRHRISAQFGHDPARLVAHYQRLQNEMAGRLLRDDGATRRLDATNPTGRDEIGPAEPRR